MNYCSPTPQQHHRWSVGDAVNVLSENKQRNKIESIVNKNEKLHHIKYQKTLAAFNFSMSRHSGNGGQQRNAFGRPQWIIFWAKRNQPTDAACVKAEKSLSASLFSSLLLEHPAWFYASSNVLRCARKALDLFRFDSWETHRLFPWCAIGETCGSSYHTAEEITIFVAKAQWVYENKCLLRHDASVLHCLDTRCVSLFPQLKTWCSIQLNSLLTWETSSLLKIKWAKEKKRS